METREIRLNAGEVDNSSEMVKEPSKRWYEFI